MDEASLVDNPPENNPSLPENGVEDSSKPAAEQPMTDAGDLPSAITDFYRGKSILLTGATGFVGKAVLWKLLETLGDGLGKVYLLVRNGSNKRSKIGRPLDRVKNEILQTKVRPLVDLFVSFCLCMVDSRFFPCAARWAQTPSMLSCRRN